MAMPAGLAKALAKKKAGKSGVGKSRASAKKTSTGKKKVGRVGGKGLTAKQMKFFGKGKK